MKTNACGRCDAIIPSGWENGWPLFGTIDIGFPAQAFGALGRMDHIADREHFLWWSEGHPAMTENGAQHVCFKWDEDSPWRLCYSCQKELLNKIGDFFKIPERVKELAAIPEDRSQFHD